MKIYKISMKNESEVTRQDIEAFREVVEECNRDENNTLIIPDKYNCELIECDKVEVE